jgi:hypothetical protein
MARAEGHGAMATLAGIGVAWAEKRYCKEMESCAEAVENWCNGHAHRDRDGDGIPCENICPSWVQSLAEEELNARYER